MGDKPKGMATKGESPGGWHCALLGTLAACFQLPRRLGCPARAVISVQGS